VEEAPFPSGTYNIGSVRHHTEGNGTVVAVEHSTWQWYTLAINIDRNQFSKRPSLLQRMWGTLRLSIPIASTRSTPLR
jgi:hypothetical protein